MVEPWLAFCPFRSGECHCVSALLATLVKTSDEELNVNAGRTSALAVRFVVRPTL